MRRKCILTVKRNVCPEWMFNLCPALFWKTLQAIFFLICSLGYHAQYGIQDICIQIKVIVMQAKEHTLLQQTHTRTQQDNTSMLMTTCRIKMVAWKFTGKQNNTEGKTKVNALAAVLCTYFITWHCPYVHRVVVVLVCPCSVKVHNGDSDGWTEKQVCYGCTCSAKKYNLAAKWHHILPFSLWAAAR